MSPITSADNENPAWGPAWPAPAKLNLMLRVIGRRSDGYHELQTVFQFLDVWDDLYFRVRGDGAITRLEGPAGLPPAQDLVVRAAHLLRQATGSPQGVDIRLKKRLPMGAGLGGGSSDAATTLVALNQLWKAGQSVDTLAKLGLELGADVPVFVRGHAAWAEGIGEQLTAIDLEEPWFVVLLPDCHVATADIFQAPELTRNSGRITIADFTSGAVENDCEAVVRERHPAVGDALGWLSAFARARLTGTGAGVFARFAGLPEAEQVLAQMPKHWRGFVARARNHSPLQTALARMQEHGVAGGT